MKQTDWCFAHGKSYSRSDEKIAISKQKLYLGELMVFPRSQR